MIAKRLFLIALFTSAAGTALAQMPTRIDMSQWPRQEQAGQWRGSTLHGLEVFDDKRQGIGTIADALIGVRGRLDAVIIDLASLTGTHEFIAVPFDQIQLSVPGLANAEDVGRGGDAPRPAGAPQLSGPDGSSAAGAARQEREQKVTVTLSLSKEDVRAAPRFEMRARE